MVMLAGTVAAAVSLLEREMTAPPAGAGLRRVTVPVDSCPPATVAGLRTSEASDDGEPITRLSKMCSPLLQLEFESIRIEPGGVTTAPVAGPNEKITGSGS